MSICVSESFRLHGIVSFPSNIKVFYYHLLLPYIYIYMNFTAPGLCNKSVKRAYIYIYIYINRRSNKGKNNIIITSTTIIIN